MGARANEAVPMRFPPLPPAYTPKDFRYPRIEGIGLGRRISGMS